jgi:Nif-specific regulatory protein
MSFFPASAQRIGPTASVEVLSDVDELTALDQVARALADDAELRPSIASALKTLTRQPGGGIVRGTVVVSGDARRQGEIRVVEGSPSAWRRGVAARAETSIRKALDAGRPVALARVSADRAAGPIAGSRPSQDLTVVSAPLVLEGRAVGAVSIEYAFSPERDLDRASAFTGALASILAQAVAADRRLELERQRLQEEAGDLNPSGLPVLSKLVGTSDPLGQVRALVAQVAPSNTTVLLRGESGTGKGLIAYAIHKNSPRAKKPFVTVSCAALPRELIESELFGYEQGAFTGADRAKKGRLELAKGGTLFLDEVGELPPEVQVKLLRVLQAREFERLGGTQTISLDVRVLAATNRNLDKAIAAGQFREDLYYRLSVFPIFVPPLRERKADVLLLADHFLEKFSREQGRQISRISTPAIDMLMSYHWPGNVRELANAIERAVVVCDGAVIHSHYLPPTLQTAESTGTVSNRSLKELVEAVEKDALQDALKSARGNRATAARLLRTTRRILNYRLRAYGIDWRRFQD